MGDFKWICSRYLGSKYIAFYQIWNVNIFYFHKFWFLCSCIFVLLYTNYQYFFLEQNLYKYIFFKLFTVQIKIKPIKNIFKLLKRILGALDIFLNLCAQSLIKVSFRCFKYFLSNLFQSKKIIKHIHFFLITC